MVNLVVVSHSARLAEGVAELAGQMMQGGCRLITAAGVDDEEHPIGTDAVKVLAAIEEVFDPSGVVILMDLGSAVMSAETAVELLDPEKAQRVRLCAAPLVEGALAAVVTAASGATLDEVIAAATDALTAKRAQLGETPPSAATVLAPFGGDARHVSWRVQNPHGLHARPIARLVSVLSPFTARLTLEKAGQFADATRVNQVAALQVRQNDEIALYAEGEQADAALKALLDLAHIGFGEQFEQQANHLLNGKPVAQTRVTAPAGFLPDLLLPDSLPDSPVRDPDEERQRFATALSQAQQDLAQLTSEIAARYGAHYAGIFEAQAMLLADEDLQETVAKGIASLGSATAAWRQATAAMVQSYAELEDDYLRVRELDVRDLQARVLNLLNYGQPPAPWPTEESIVVAHELFPSRLAMLDRPRVAGIALEGGHPLSHTAILAQAMGIPMVVEIGGLIDRVRHGQIITLDGAQGTLAIA
jgi:PTS hybrid protein